MTNIIQMGCRRRGLCRRRARVVQPEGNAVMTPDSGTGAVASAEARAIDTGTEELQCTLSERVATITLNRPHARNALSDTLSPALRTLIQTCADSPDVGAVLITGAGQAFCAGGDVKGMGGRGTGPTLSDEQRVAQLQDRQRRLTGALYHLPKPTMAALPGPAAGAGLSIALACDLRLAASSASMVTGYARIGLSGDYGITWLLHHLVGPARARELLFEGRKIDAATCATLGLVNRVVADDRLQAEAFALARQLANGPAVALAMIKRNLLEAPQQSFLEALDAEADRLVACARTEDHREAVQAFVERRPAVFVGR